MMKAETGAFRFSSSLVVLLSTALFAPAWQMAPRSSTHGEMVNQYCVSCHNKLKTAGLTRAPLIKLMRAAGIEPR